MKIRTLIGSLIWIAGILLAINVIASNDNAVTKIDLSGINSPIVTLGYNQYLRPTHTCDVGMFFSQAYDQVQVGLNGNTVTYQGQQNSVSYQAKEGGSVSPGTTQQVSGVNVEGKTLTVNCNKNVGWAVFLSIVILVGLGLIGAIVAFAKFED